jgi:N-glycosylase/DNA lyase
LKNERYTVEGDLIRVDRREPFDARKIAASGQVFRVIEEDGAALFYAADAMCRVCEGADGVTIHASPGHAAFFVRYFDLERSYAALNAALAQKGIETLDRAAAFGRGIRILRQDAFETLISFIISSNNNIARIKKIIGVLCARLGARRGGYRAFPSPAALAKRPARFFEECGAGYRAAWIAAAARAAACGLDLNALDALRTPELCARLRQFDGVGPKVADCIALFAYGRLELFPVDTWVKKIYADLFNESPPPAVMRQRLHERFGPSAGLAQQYLFYYYRSAREKSAAPAPR